MDCIGFGLIERRGVKKNVGGDLILFCLDVFYNGRVNDLRGLVTFSFFLFCSCSLFILFFNSPNLGELEGGRDLSLLDFGKKIIATLYAVFDTYRIRWQSKKSDNKLRVSWSCALHMTFGHLWLLFSCHVTLYAVIDAYKIAANPLPWIFM